jgi:beta-lactamase regulating signal transducer with metallopeptidase domain
MDISDLDSGPLLLYFKKLESYLAELEQLEPIKPSRHVVLSTSTAAPPSTLITLSESLNDTDISVNSTISSVEPNLAINESETKYSTGTVVVLGCVGVAVVAVVIAVFVFGRQRFIKKSYIQASTQET